VSIKRKTQWILTGVTFLFSSLHLAIPLIHAAESSCVRCHSDEKQLQALYKSKKMIIEEGEG
jgi:hypothetical protein